MDEVRRYLVGMQETLEMLPVARIRAVIDLLFEARITGRQVFILGNGGSAATASHFACDLGKNTRRNGWPHLRVTSLADNMVAFSAYANDEGYENVFSQQLYSLVQPKDVVIGISTSGNSPNVLRAIELAREAGAHTVGFTGIDSGRLGPIVDLNVPVPSDCIEQVEDTHLILEHLICTTLRRRLAAEPSDSFVGKNPLANIE